MGQPATKPLKERVRAVIVEDENLLTIKRVRPTRTYWTFPGGGVETNESRADAVKRECKEELGLDVEVKELMFDSVVEEPDVISHQYFYRCEAVSGKLGTGHGPEFQPNQGYEGTHEIEWLPLKKIPDLNLLPLEARDAILSKIT